MASGPRMQQEARLAPEVHSDWSLKGESRESFAFSEVLF